MSDNRHWKPWLAAALLALLAPAAGGQPEAADAPERPAEAEQAEAAEADQEAAQPQAPEKAAPDQEAPASSPELFLPTEDISEDFAVPFPSDI